MVDQKLTLTLSPKKVVYFLGTIMIFLVITHVIGVLMKFVFGHNSVYGLVPFFNLDAEQNAPTFFSSCLFLINSILLFIMWKVREITDKRQWIWLLLSGISCFLAIDEFAEIHERFSEPVKLGIPISSFLDIAWVIPYGIGTVLLLTLITPFFRQINKKIRRWFGVSVLTYLTGALGFEMIGAWYVSTRPFDIVCGFLIMFEESLEMMGLIMLIYTLLSLLQSKCGKFEIIIPTS